MHEHPSCFVDSVSPLLCVSCRRRGYPHLQLRRCGAEVYSWEGADGKIRWCVDSAPGEVTSPCTKP